VTGDKKNRQKFVIEDITSTEHIVIDSLDKVKKVQDEVRKIHSLQPAMSDVLFLLKWNSFSEEEKDKKYNKYVSHEVNVFLYFKDREYFQKKIHPFLLNKMEKSFVDHYLLGNKEIVLKYAQIEKFTSLNPFEKCLLIDVVASKDKKTALKLAEWLELNSETTKPSEEQQNKIFDTVLNLNMLQGGNKIHLDDLQEDSASDAYSEDPFSNITPNAPPPPPPGGSLFGGSLFGRSLLGGPPVAHPMGASGGGGLYGAGAPTSSGLFGNSSASGPSGFFGGGMDAQRSSGFGSNSNTHPQSNLFQVQQQQNMFNVQNQMQDNFQQFNQMQANDAFMPQMQQNYYQPESDKFDLLNEVFEIRQQMPSQFQALEEACEYSETSYYGNNSLSSSHIFSMNKFWADLAMHTVKTGSISCFLSSSFMFSYSSSTEMVMTWAVLDLEYSSKRHAIRSRGGKGISIDPTSNIIVFKKEIKETEADLNNNILVIHRFFEEGKKGTEERVKEYLTHQVYGCEVIVTNVSSKPHNFQILWQIPEGSLPVKDTNYQKSKTMYLNSYSTTTFEFYFYFPVEGEYTQFPSNITIEDKVIAVANKCTFKVCLERTEDSFETFRDILISGNHKEIFTFLQTKNLLKGEKGFRFSDMYWMLDDPKFCLKVIEILRERRIFDGTTWQYGFKHKDEKAIKEYLVSSDVDFTKRLGNYFESSLITLNDENNKVRHLDYFPLVNARAHSVGKNINAGLLNVQFRATYYRFLMNMTEKNKLTDSDWLQFAYYLLLQDRIKETIQIMTGEIRDSSLLNTVLISRKIDPKDITEETGLKLQYDYMMAYIDFFTGIDTDFKVARDIAQKYENYPVISWRVLFTEILDQLKEFDGVEEGDFEIDQEDEEKKKQNLKKSKKIEPYLECEIEGQHINVEYDNIGKISIKYYVIDLEVLFSRTPFLIQNTEDLANAKPFKTVEYDLEKNLKSCKYEIDPEFHSQNVMIEVQGESKQQFLTYFSNSMKVHIIEDFGELKVTDKDGNKLLKVYIKVIAQHSDGSTKFFKDGYTDIRGKFEYAQINSKKIAGIEKFAILVMSDHNGALTKEARPPRNIEKIVAKQDKDMDFMKPQQYMRYCERNDIGFSKKF
jgi:hypothetical protein